MTGRLKAGLCAALLTGLVPGVSRAENTVGLRAWFAEYHVSSADESGYLGRRPFYGAQAQSPLPGLPLTAVAAAAHGEGWDLRTTRYDLMLGATYQQNMLSAGAAWHAIGFRQKDVQYSVFEHGPEALVAFAVPVSSWSYAKAAATLLPVLMLSDNSGASAVTYGYTWDVSVGAGRNEWSLAAGYRANYVADNAATKAQEFKGPYGLVGYSW